MKRPANSNPYPNQGTVVFRCATIPLSKTNVFRSHFRDFLNTPPLDILSHELFIPGRYLASSGGLPREIRAKIASYLKPHDWRRLFQCRMESPFKFDDYAHNSYRWRSLREIQLILHCLGFERRQWEEGDGYIYHAFALYEQ